MTPAPEQEQYGYGVASQTGLDPVEKITGLYNEFLGRAPDAEGLDYWTNAYTRGDTSLNDIRQSFMGSPEYAQRMESINAPQTPSSPLDYLVNPPDVNYPIIDSGYGYLNQPDLAKPIPPLPVQSGLDPVQKIAGFYNEFFGRAPDTEGLDYWTNAYTRGNTSLNDIRQSFMNSPEYQNMQRGTGVPETVLVNPPNVNYPTVDSGYGYLNPPEVARPSPSLPVQDTFPQLPITIEPRSPIPPGFNPHILDENGRIIGYRDPPRRSTPPPPVQTTLPQLPITIEPSPRVIPPGFDTRLRDEYGNVIGYRDPPRRTAPMPPTSLERAAPAGLSLLDALFGARRR